MSDPQAPAAAARAGADRAARAGHPLAQPGQAAARRARAAAAPVVLDLQPVGPIAIVQWCAPEWRTTFVTPSRSTQPNSSACAGSATSTARGAWASMPAARSTSRALASSPARLISR